MDQDDAADGLATLSRKPLRTGADYVARLRSRKLSEAVAEPVDDPIIRPSINAVAETYDLANDNPELASATSPLTGEHQPLPAHRDQPRRSRHAEQSAAPARAVDGHLLPALLQSLSMKLVPAIVSAYGCNGVHRQPR